MLCLGTCTNLAHVAPKILKGILTPGLRYSTGLLLVSRASITGIVSVLSIEYQVCDVVVNARTRKNI